MHVNGVFFSPICILWKESAQKNEYAVYFKIHSMFIISADSDWRSRRLAPLHYNEVTARVDLLAHPWQKSEFQPQISTAD